jgi:hypothetical protein
MQNITVPWNHQPTSIDYGNESRSFTCPAGHYARITAVLSAAQGAFATGTTSAEGGAGAGAGSAVSAVVPIFITAGDIVTTELNVTDTDALMKINGNIVGRVEARANAGGSTAAGNLSQTKDGISWSYFHVEVYKNLQ